MVRFKLAQIDAAIEDFDRAEELDPRITPYLWQRGLAYYYGERYEEGARQFEVDLAVNPQDLEETLWHYLCLAQSRGFDQARSLLLPVRHDPRRFMATIYQLYAGAIAPAALLKSIQQDGDRGCFYGHLYLGLYFESRREPEAAREQLAIAVDRYPLDDYMWHLAVVHQHQRQWV
jgi:lipoprotein NlpI